MSITIEESADKAKQTFSTLDDGPAISEVEISNCIYWIPASKGREAKFVQFKDSKYQSDDIKSAEIKCTATGEINGKAVAVCEIILNDYPPDNFRMIALLARKGKSAFCLGVRDLGAYRPNTGFKINKLEIMDNVVCCRGTDSETNSAIPTQVLHVEDFDECRNLPVK